MIATEAALYGPTSASGSGVTTLLVCGCGQEIGVHQARPLPPLRLLPELNADRR